MTAFGEWSLWLAAAFAAATVILACAGALRDRAEFAALAKGTTYATFAAVLIATTALWSALFSRDFSLRYVATNTSVNLPRIYTGSALWAGHQGSLLLWVLMLSGCAAVAVLSDKHADRQRQSWTVAVLGVVVLYFLGMMIVGANPFARMDFTPDDGLGMSPRLQVPAMLLQPPLLTIALAATSVPFAIALSAFATKRRDVLAERAVHRWSVLAWLLLTLSVLVGFLWDYTSPEWSGRWPRDFSRDSVFLPWLSCTALLYTTVARARGDVRRVHLPTMVLTSVTFVVALFSAYVARAGIVDSVHAYAPSPLAKWFLILAAGVALVSTYMARREMDDRPGQASNAIGDAQSGVVAVQAEVEQRESSAAPTTRVSRVAWLPFLAGVALTVAGLAGLAFRSQTRLTLATGASANVIDPYGRAWTFTSQGISLYTELNKQLLVASLSLSREGRRVDMATAEQRQYIDVDENPVSKPIAVVTIRRSPLQDLRVSLQRTVDRGTALVQIEFVPLASWIWFGGLLMAIGGVIVAMSNEPKPELNDAVRPRVSDDDVEAAIRRAGASLVSCEECGPRPEPDAVYCSNCGRKLR